ncbi:MAG: bifunctional folylpolyglutamate synthase/dihydrofolate synthase [Ignavibacteriaceae bacterium]|nr:bifunctional folylpolyglutamate synthase/dihydrofolate synthase [Ignavibacteriaceae bacterium]
MSPDKYKLVLDKLFSLHQLGVKLGLENTIEFLKHLGNPQRDLRCFHVAGSNGKGSTSSFIASILMEYGYKTGLYTSPHFIRFNERIKINGVEISDDYIVEFFEKHEDYIDSNALTFFETTTCMAFAYFKDQGIDYAVIETGLGGRLDSTNVINPLASIITSISLEHTNILGHSIDLITAEKAEIIKRQGKTFIGKLPDIAREIIENKCALVGNELFILPDFIMEKANHVELYTEELNIYRLESPLPGNFQRLNASLAILSVYETLNLTDEKIFSKGVRNVILNTGIQGRFEYVNESPYLILDSAHNPEGIHSFLTEFDQHKPKFRNCVLLFAALRDKNIREMLSPVKMFFNEIIITKIENERAAEMQEIASIAESLNIKYRLNDSPENAVQSFLRKAEMNDCLVVLGSMYLIGRVKEYLKRIK